MNKQAPLNAVEEWTEAAAAVAPSVAGYEAWLQAELVQGEADLDAGKTVALADLRKDLGLE
ncbi:hypothetical protein [Neogemmobacter tilapiae]|uniref:Uncharacterized protein n=1 Tax=Neogemmobacter tilapiae TaxID=875041 RepID=A0A918TSI4_9RHOB|nr:hypothetical protein [Gemmobacter tilapiae]GHC54800.1 hypothetical protein GCM10007315_17250 [Gemmobacter tilapiae]